VKGENAMREVETAADAVLRAMRALDARRHETAPTLEREYQRALETYFVVAEHAAGRSAGDEDAPDAGVLAGGDVDSLEAIEEEAHAGDLRSDLASIAGHFAAARRALRLARAYREEPGTTGRRERECLGAVQRHRSAIQVLRLRMRPPAEQLVLPGLPGLAKTRPAAADVQRLIRSA
jgi:hypothetical protein